MPNASSARIAGLALLFALASCGGGSGGSGPVATGTTDSSGGSTPAPAPAPGPAPAPAPGPAPSATTPAFGPVQASLPSVSTGSQASTSVAQLANGGYVVVWTGGSASAPPTSATQGIVYAQVFDANGAKAGSPVTVFGSGSTNQWLVTGVAALPDGSFVVAASGAVLVGNTLMTRLYAQKVSATGALLPTGGTSDPSTDGGQADVLLSQPEIDVIQFANGRFFVNADGGYSLAVTSVGHPIPNSVLRELLLTVDAAGNVAGTPVDLSTGYANYSAPVVTRLGDGNFLEAGTSTVTYAPVVWKIVTAQGQVVAQQSLGAAPGNSTSNPAVTTLADGTGLLAWNFANSTTTGASAERIDGSGNVVGTMSAPMPGATVTGLANGGYVATWLSSGQLMAHYVAASGQAIGAAFVVASDVATYSVAATRAGFVVAYVAATGQGPQVFTAAYTAPAGNS